MGAPITVALCRERGIESRVGGREAVVWVKDIEAQDIFLQAIWAIEHKIGWPGKFWATWIGLLREKLLQFVVLNSGNRLGKTQL